MTGKYAPARELPADLAAARRQARTSRSWSLRVAAQQTGASESALWHLERGDRLPSTAMAELLVDGYRLDEATTGRLRTVAQPGVGRGRCMTDPSIDHEAGDP